ncbi:exodeoxyribonuclease VII large subunit [Altererythrobacter sp. TH136]|uniref:exodeoxyribonuclease VII large subunit n=1 Tax=Altererythrobacter sp. TH136 TaxID=2067415 RepID=UPI001161D505|nr:exodeoxyribonuclease VII large subunit [Altererythrobacter sp. TH136]QDM41129.1 exodeoxyribonuclease VII large subunit [Altererythrobacter sp. TH136]
MPAPDFLEESGGLVAKGRAGDNAEPLSVSELAGMLKRTVEDRFGFVRLRGELSGVKRAASGHLYCCLKDESAVIDGVMWRGPAAALAFRPEDGLEVVASGKLTTYPGRSKYQVVIEKLELAGEGALLALLEKLRLRLAAEGLFAPERKRPLPFLPATIGVVTSPTGAVIRDILHRLADRFPSRVLVWPVLVQGQGAAEQVATAVRGFSALPEGHALRPDLVIVARGGGSIEDLWSFNEEAVVRAIAECSIPTISAVGHETDTTLADHAADRRAPTPTAAAEIAVPVLRELSATLADFAHRKQRCALRPVDLGRERLEARAKRLPQPQVLLAPQAQKLDDLADRLRRGLRDRAAHGRERLARLPLNRSVLDRAARDAQTRLAHARLSPALLTTRMDREQAQVVASGRLLASFDPRAPLTRGFALVRDADGKLLRSKDEAARSPALAVEFADGTLEVAPLSGMQRKPRPVAPAKRSVASSAQDDLFG